MNRNRSLTACASAILLCVGLTACTGSTATTGTTGGAAGGAVGGAAAVGGQAPVTEVDTCVVDFVPNSDAVTGNNSATGMVWGGGQITFSVSVACPKPLTRGTLTYQIQLTDYTGATTPYGKSFNMAGVTSAKFPYAVACKPGTWIFQYQWEAAETGDANPASKQDANSSYGTLLTGSNCK